MDFQPTVVIADAADPFLLAQRRHEALVLAADEATHPKDSAAHYARAEEYRVRLDVLASGGNYRR